LWGLPECRQCQKISDRTLTFQRTLQAICARVVNRLAAESALGRYANIANGPGFAQTLARVVTELRSAKLRPDALSGVAPDFLPLVEAYEANLGEDGFTDWAGLLTIATDAVMSEGFTHRLIGLPTILLDVPVTSGAELDLLRAFGPRIPDLLFFTPAADERTLARVQAALPMEVINLDEAKPDAASANAAAGALARLQRHLFKETSNPAKLADDDEVFISSAPGEERECVEIARRVLALARDGVLFHEIAVVLRSPEQYRATLEEFFDRAGIPPHFARGSRRPDPAGWAFYVLLSCAAEGLSARRLAEYLSLGQVPDATPEGRAPEAIPRSERWVTPDQDFLAALMAEEETEETERAQEAESSHTPDGPVTNGQLRAPRRGTPTSRGGGDRR
jgi:ATP-dependent helicase/nuclease subunit B